MKKQRTCIFCGKEGNITKEHFWPEWLGQHFPKSCEDRHISEIHESEAKSPKRIIKKYDRQGHVITKKMRVVCRECNNGWMSNLEAKVKPIISALLIGHDTRINKEQIFDLSLWATVKTIVGEHAEGHMALTPSADRYLVYKNYKIPDYFRIFLGVHSSESKAAYSRHSTTFSLTMNGLNPPLTPDIQRNTQIVSFLIGPLLLHVIAVRVSGIRFNDETLSSSELIRIWPAAADEINLLSLKVIDDEELSAIASKLSKLLSSSRVLYGGPLPKNF